MYVERSIGGANVKKTPTSAVPASNIQTNVGWRHHNVFVSDLAGKVDVSVVRENSLLLDQMDGFTTVGLVLNDPIDVLQEEVFFVRTMMTKNKPLSQWKISE